MVKLRNLELRVVLDTNALYTASASYLIRKEVTDLIAQHKNVPGLRVTWHLPSVVRDERHFQMRTEAHKFLDAIGRLERLLGHNLNITRDILDTRVREAIDRQVEEHGLTVITFDPTSVDWERVVADAAFRRPPFQIGEKEKGFRDAIIVECFLQLVATSPVTASLCRLVLVSGDELLRAAVSARVGEASNVHVLDSIDALKGLLNTLGSAVDEDFIKALQPRAERLFYSSSGEDSLYHQWDILSQLKTALSNASVPLPTGADKYAVETWSISEPRFLKKEGQRVSWISRFTARLKALKVLEHTARPQPSSLLFPSSLSEQGIIYTTAQPSNVSTGPAFQVPGFTAPPGEPITFYNLGFPYFPEERAVGFGTATLDVTWTVSVTTGLMLKTPRLGVIAFVDVTWE